VLYVLQRSHISNPCVSRVFSVLLTPSTPHSCPPYRHSQRQLVNRRGEIDVPADRFSRGTQEHTCLLRYIRSDMRYGEVVVLLASTLAPSLPLTRALSRLAVCSLRPHSFPPPILLSSVWPIAHSIDDCCVRISFHKPRSFAPRV